MSLLDDAEITEDTGLVIVLCGHEIGTAYGGWDEVDGLSQAFYDVKLTDSIAARVERDLRGLTVKCVAVDYEKGFVDLFFDDSQEYTRIFFQASIRQVYQSSELIVTQPQEEGDSANGT